MAEDQAPAMHPDFGRWYGAVNLGDDRERIHFRWNGVSALVASASPADIETLIRIVFRLKPEQSPDSLARIRKPFKEADDLFDMEGNDRELEILSGAALSVIFEKGEDHAATVALTVTTTALGGTRKPELPMDLLMCAERTIATVAEKNRKRPTLSRHILTQAPKVDFQEAAQTIKAQPNFDSVVAALPLAAQSTHEALTRIVRSTEQAVSAASRFIAIQDEELQLLWWLFGQRSRDLDCAFSDIPAEAQPLVLAKELADLTEFPPGPISAKALLSRAGLKDKKRITVPAAVNRCDVAWLRSIISGMTASSVSQPIHFAIQRRLETGDQASWVAGWAAAAGIEADRSLPILTLGNLFYRECLLASSFRD